MIELRECDEDITLPSDTLILLNQFLAERAQQTERAERVRYHINADVPLCSFESIEEDWQLSQFWYNDKTKNQLAMVCQQLVKNKLSRATSPINIGLLSCPSLYEPVRKANPEEVIQLFEYDQRFSIYGKDFVLYDYNEINSRCNSLAESDYLSEYNKYFDIIIADPPFLSEECLEKISQIVRNFSKDDTDIILCSGDVVGDWAEKFLHLNKCKFRPEHERNLANEFVSYANFDLDEMIDSFERLGGGINLY